VNIQIIDALNENDWRKFVYQHPNGNIFHTPELFHVFENTQNHRPLLMAAVDQDGQVLALLPTVQVTLMKGFLSQLTTRSIAYGGVLCSSDPDGIKALEVLLHTYSENYGKEALFTEMRNLHDLSSVQSVLSQCGFVYEDHLDYLIDLNRSPGEVLQNMGPRTRKHIRQALRKGRVIVEEFCDSDLLPAWYELICKSYKAARVPLADISLFDSAFSILQPRGMAQFWLAHIDNTYVAASAELVYKDTIYGWYSGVDRAYASETPGEQLMWRVLEQGAMSGFKTYDFGGAGLPDQKSGVRDFKAKFGGRLDCYGRNTCVHAPLLLHLSKLGYRVLTNRLPLARRFLNPRSGSEDGIRRNANIGTREMFDDE
jgi:serine/alanine adding enzyme